jgi:hypothetical protein
LFVFYRLYILLYNVDKSTFSASEEAWWLHKKGGIYARKDIPCEMIALKAIFSSLFSSLWETYEKGGIRLRLKLKYLSMSLLLALFLCNNTSIAQSNGKQYFFPDNSEKQLKAESATNFYQSNKIKNYEEFVNADVNIREKVLYEETYKVVERRLKEYDQFVWQYKQNKHDNISPKRQVYFFYTLKEVKKGTYYTRVAIVDVETKKLLMTGKNVEY